MQKLAQRDAGQLQELLQISCLMTWMAPKLQLYLGDSPALHKIKDMWLMGCLGHHQTAKYKKNHVFFGFQPNPSNVRWNLDSAALAPLEFFFWVIPGLFPKMERNRHILQNLPFVRWNLNSAVL